MRGALGAATFPHLLRVLVRGRKSGQLRLQRGRVVKTVSLAEGRFVFATSTEADDRLGELLLRKGLIGYRVLQESVHAIKEGKRQGAHLVESGALSKQDLVEGVIEHTQQILFSLFQWEEGEYAFLEEEHSSPEVIVLRRPPGDLIREGIRGIQKWSRIRAAVGPLSQRYTLSAESSGLMSALSLQNEEVALVAGLDGVMSVEELCANHRSADFLICRMVWGLWAAGLLDRVPQDVAPAEESSDKTEPHLGASLEEEIEHFNRLHRFLFQQVSEDLREEALDFFERAFQAVCAEYETLYQGVAIDGGGELDAEVLARNIMTGEIAGYRHGFDRLLEIEFSVAREMLGARNAAHLEEGVLALRQPGKKQP